MATENEPPTDIIDRAKAVLASWRDAMRTLSRAARIVFRAIADSPIGEMGLYWSGIGAGRRADPRDWSMPEMWHRGYMRGSLLRYKARQREMGERVWN